MNPELSRKLGPVVCSPLMGLLGPEFRRAFIQEIEKAESMEDLSPASLMLIRSYERSLRENNHKGKSLPPTEKPEAPHPSSEEDPQPLPPLKEPKQPSVPPASKAPSVEAGAVKPPQAKPAEPPRAITPAIAKPPAASELQNTELGARNAPRAKPQQWKPKPPQVEKAEGEPELSEEEIRRHETSIEFINAGIPEDLANSLAEEVSKEYEKAYKSVLERYKYSLEKNPEERHTIEKLAREIAASNNTLRGTIAQMIEREGTGAYIPKTDNKEAKQNLSKAKIVDYQNFNEGSANEVWLVEYEDGSKGVYKPAMGEDDTLRDEVDDRYWVREATASDVADLLGLGDMVPATVIGEDDLQEGEGSIQQFVAGTKVAKKLTDADPEKWGSDFQTAKAAAFDFVLANSDRHTGNWLIKSNKIHLIDHGLCFPHNDSKFGDSEKWSKLWYRALNKGFRIPLFVSRWKEKLSDIKELMKSRGFKDKEISLTLERLSSISEFAGRTFKEFAEEVLES